MHGPTSQNHPARYRVRYRSLNRDCLVHLMFTPYNLLSRLFGRSDRLSLSITDDNGLTYSTYRLGGLVRNAFGTYRLVSFAGGTMAHAQSVYSDGSHQGNTREPYLIDLMQYGESF